MVGFGFIILKSMKEVGFELELGELVRRFLLEVDGELVLLRLGIVVELLEEEEEEEDDDPIVED